MITVLTQSALRKYDKCLQIYQFDDELLKSALELFQEYKARGVILEGEFHDDRWILTNEMKRVSILFDMDEESYYLNANEWTECDYKCYLDAAKTYAVFMLGAYRLEKIQEMVHCALALGQSSFEEATQFQKEASHLAELIKLLPGYSSQRDAVVECLEENQIYFTKDRKRRILQDFTAYFRFHEMLEGYWEHASEQERLFFFPLYLWWKITSVLPLRPTEFLLIPRECLSKAGEEYVLTIRRTRLKGKRKKRAYKIDEDYQRYEYVIPEQIATLICWYMDKTDMLEASPWNCLFRKAAAQKYLEQHGSQYQKGPYTYLMLTKTLDRLYEVSGASDISKIHLGDSRHIAMMNLIISGGSPTICMELAGHSNIDISSHYYANMSALVECATYELYRKTRNGPGTVLTGSSRSGYTGKIVDEDGIKVENGWCRSKAWKMQDISDCIQAVNEEGQIADCISCRYYLPSNPGIHLKFYDIEEGKRTVDSDTWFLIQMIENVRKGIGIQEDIRTAILRLQRSAYHYRECIIQGWEEGNSGKTEKDG